MSLYALLTGALLTLLLAPLLWMGSRLARDHMIAGTSLVVGTLLLLVLGLRAHLGSRLVDITAGVVGFAAAVLALATISGVVTRWRARRLQPTVELPAARLHRTR